MLWLQTSHCNPVRKTLIRVDQHQCSTMNHPVSCHVKQPLFLRMQLWLRSFVTAAKLKYCGKKQRSVWFAIQRKREAGKRGRVGTSEEQSRMPLSLWKGQACRWQRCWTRKEEMERKHPYVKGYNEIRKTISQSSQRTITFFSQMWTCRSREAELFVHDSRQCWN